MFDTADTQTFPTTELTIVPCPQSDAWAVVNPPGRHPGRRRVRRVLPTHAPADCDGRMTTAGPSTGSQSSIRERRDHGTQAHEHHEGRRKTCSRGDPPTGLPITLRAEAASGTPAGGISPSRALLPGCRTGQTRRAERACLPFVRRVMCRRRLLLGPCGHPLNCACG